MDQRQTNACKSPAAAKLSCDLLMAFSWRQNYQELMMGTERTTAGDVKEISVIKVICTVAIIFVHLCTFLQHVASGYTIFFRI